MEYKAYELGIKQVGEGKVMATLAKLGVRDRDGDVLRKGLVGGHQIVAIKPQHKWDHVNLGVADVYENGDSMEASMEFNMNIQSARDWWEAIRFSHEKHHRTQYSFGFEPTDHEHGQHSDGKAARFLNRIALAECSPVLIGASVGSQTLSVKAYDDLPESEEMAGSIDDLKAAGVRIQSLVFSKDKWESAEAVRAWLSSHDYSTELDTTGSSWRARQEDPSKFSRLRSFCINPSREASSESCRVMAVGGPMKESRSMAGPVVPMGTIGRETPQVPSDTLPSVEDYKDYPEDRRPPLPVMIKWLRLYRYHMPFLRDIRKRDGKEISAETIGEFKALMEEMLEVTQGLNIKLMTSALLPNVEEETLNRQRYERRLTELSADTVAAEEQKLQALQQAALELEQKSRARAAAMRQMFQA